MPAKIPQDKISQNPVHITYRLLGSIPKSVVDSLKFRRDQALSVLEEDVMRLPESHREQVRHQRKFIITGEYEIALDNALHQLSTKGPMFLSQRNIAQIIISSWLFLQEEGSIYVYAICVMSNHVHLIVRASDSNNEVLPGPLMSRHKAYTAKQIKKELQGIEGGVWELVYFDRRVRSGKFSKVMWYVLNNPVKSGLVKNWQNWDGTYLNPDFDALFRDSQILL